MQELNFAKVQNFGKVVLGNRKDSHFSIHNFSKQSLRINPLIKRPLHQSAYGGKTLHP
ncbi:hypothetical protein MTP09_04840 [Chryseobacterium suipulveris]|uniref:Uncharacterized protein n=1 Tax=Chryseobacterium suipulveris TaxID=2929800 RepID=A0ABY4BRY5_9FLAO|nr:hypothetical protein [Chryseobacterium suipulveris]UOE41963.1 hypothetical protein MTP09_04840 [Chryseobacterium suipulveris]